MEETKLLFVIGVGNEYRSDDGAGLAAIRALKAMQLLNVQCIESNGDATELGDLLSGVSGEEQAISVILIDAVSSGTLPGTIHRIDVKREPLPTNLSFSSTHSMGVAEAIQLAPLLGTLPACLLVLGIEGQNFATG